MEGTKMSSENERYEEEQSEKIKGSSIVNIANTFFAPSRAFKAIKARPNWLIPLIVIIIAPLVYYALCWSEYEVMIIQSIEASLETQGQVITDSMMALPLAIARIGTLVVTPIGVLLSILVQATLYFVAAKLVKSTVNFKQMFSLCTHVGLISIFTWGIMALMTKLTGAMPLHTVTSLTSFLPESYNGTIIQGLMAPIEIFAIWSLTLMYMGLRIVADFSKRVAGVVIALAFSFTVIISVVTVILTNLATTLQG
jgi:hypothetical protein